MDHILKPSSRIYPPKNAQAGVHEQTGMERKKRVAPRRGQPIIAAAGKGPAAEPGMWSREEHGNESTKKVFFPLVLHSRSKGSGFHIFAVDISALHLAFMVYIFMLLCLFPFRKSNQN